MTADRPTGRPSPPWSGLDVLDRLGPVAVLRAVRGPAGHVGDLVVEFANPALAGLLGRPAGELVGDGLLRLVPEAAHDGTLDLCRRVLGTGEPFHGELPWSAAAEVRAALPARITRLDPDRLVLTTHTLPDVGLIHHEGRDAAAGDALVGLDREGRITVWSVGAERLYGWAAHEVVGSDASVLVPDGERDEQAAAVEALAAGEAVAPFRCRRRRRNGDTFPVELTLWALRDGSGAVVGTTSVHRDITDELAVAEELHATRERLAAAVEAVTDHHMILTSVREDGEIVDFVFVDVNEPASAYLGMTPDMLIGARLLDTLPGLVEQFAAIAGVVATGEPVTFTHVPYDHELLHEVRTYDIRVVRSGDGISVTARDVTGQA